MIGKDIKIIIGAWVVFVFCVGLAFGIYKWNKPLINSDSAECAYAKKSYIEHKYEKELVIVARADASADFENCETLVEKWGYTFEKGGSSGIYRKDVPEQEYHNWINQL